MVFSRQKYVCAGCGKELQDFHKPSQLKYELLYRHGAIFTSYYFCDLACLRLWLGREKT